MKRTVGKGEAGRSRPRRTDRRRPAIRADRSDREDRAERTNRTNRPASGDRADGADRAYAELVSKVMAHYPGKVRSIRLLSDKGKKAVWSVSTDRGERIVKKVPFGDRDIDFMAYAVDYMRKRGLRTPAVIRTTDGKNFVALNEDRYVVFEAVRGRTPDYERKEELRLIMRGMAQFHKASQGIASPTRYYPSLLLYVWETRKRANIERLTAWKAAAAAKKKPTEFDRLFLRHADPFLKQAEESIALLKRADFAAWAEELRTNKSLCHQDFAAGNLAIGDDGQLYVFDMDALTVDAPIRDIRKILNKVMKKGVWDLERMVAMLKAYQEVNPLTAKQYRALVAEMSFPHLVYGQASKYYKRREKSGWTEEKHLEKLRDMIATERSKGKVLQAFLGRIDEVIAHGRKR
ncbi:CotS family spore coat protein [Paenibacillus antri]|uniref:CotS family spore coat protein n=1 Tax=Paenibacillus antri TaxID=2582848 RepID=A0A5R9GHP2_9BACL|nr:CotS family spore coat protein [Paenibacillus antri]TLS53996.1 CotS family spore coat protein [Paenibacillus antri]